MKLVTSTAGTVHIFNGQTIFPADPREAHFSYCGHSAFDLHEGSASEVTCKSCANHKIGSILMRNDQIVRPNRKVNA